MIQLDLFGHAFRHYHEALRALGGLDLEVFADNLERHRASGGRPREVRQAEEAAAWLRQRLPDPERPVGDWARGVLSLCRALREGQDKPRLLSPESEVAVAVRRELARGALKRMEQSGIQGAAPLAGGLPWGVFRLMAGDIEAAAEDLVHFLQSRGPSAPAAHALGEALVNLGREVDALRAWREAFGERPAGSGWPPEPEVIENLRAGSGDDPLFSGDWWAVGAYLDGRFPRYALGTPVAVSARWKRFLAADEAFRRGELSAPVLFFSGLHPSEHGHLLPPQDAARVRRTLRGLHPDACAVHLDRLEEEGPPDRAVDRWVVLG